MTVHPSGGIKQFQNSTNIIIRLDQNGTELWNKEIVPPESGNPEARYAQKSTLLGWSGSPVRPVIACEDVVIVLAFRRYYSAEMQYQLDGSGPCQFSEERDESYLFFECVDLNGNSRWRTNPVFYDDRLVFAYNPRRIDQSRFIYTYNNFIEIASIMSGENLQTIELPDENLKFEDIPVFGTGTGFIAHAFDFHSNNRTTSIYGKKTFQLI
ncbi:MAG TPA: hypothetical protein VGB30_06970 [bacterium]